MLLKWGMPRFWFSVDFVDFGWQNTYENFRTQWIVVFELWQSNLKKSATPFRLNFLTTIYLCHISRLKYQERWGPHLKP